MSSAICYNLDQSKILSSGNGLKVYIEDKYQISRTNDFEKQKKTKSKD